MVDGCVKERWSRMSELLAMIANAHRDVERYPSPFPSYRYNPCINRKEALRNSRRYTMAEIKQEAKLHNLKTVVHQGANREPNNAQSK